MITINQLREYEFIKVYSQSPHVANCLASLLGIHVFDCAKPLIHCGCCVANGEIRPFIRGSYVDTESEYVEVSSDDILQLFTKVGGMRERHYIVKLNTNQPCFLRESDSLRMIFFWGESRKKARVFKESELFGANALKVPAWHIAHKSAVRLIPVKGEEK